MAQSLKIRAEVYKISPSHRCAMKESMEALSRYFLLSPSDILFHLEIHIQQLKHQSGEANYHTDARFEHLDLPILVVSIRAREDICWPTQPLSLGRWGESRLKQGQGQEPNIITGVSIESSQGFISIDQPQLERQQTKQFMA
jgi:hypothetical protein